MQQRHHLFIPFLFLLLLIVSCEQTGTTPDEPSIVSFSASPEEVSPGGDVTLSWTVNDATSLSIDNGVGTVTGKSTVVRPTVTTTYELTARNGSGSDTETTTVTVTGDPTDPTDPTDTAVPTGTFGVSLNANGPFQNDDPFINDADDNRIIDVGQGGTFYAQVDYEDPSGITAIEVRLVNSNPAGIAGPLNPSQEGFEIVSGPTGANCDLSSSPVDVTCVYEISVGNDVQPITERTSAEFAYIFRARVTDGAGKQSDDKGAGSRGYVNVEADGNGGGDTTTAPVVDSFAAAETTITEGSSTTLSWSLSGDAATSVAIDNGVGDVTTDDDNTVSVSPTQTTTYTLTATNAGGNDTETATVTVNSASTNNPPVANAGADQTDAVVGTEVTLSGAASSDPDTGDTLSYAWSFTSQPDGSNAALSDATTATPTFTPDVVGDYIVGLTVSDGNGGSDTDSVTVTAAASDAVIVETLEAADIDATEEGDYVEIFGPVTVIDPAYILEESTYPEGVEPEITLTDTATSAGGTVSDDDGEIFYQADEGYSGQDSFNYTLSATIDGEEVSDPGTITVNVE